MMTHSLVKKFWRSSGMVILPHFLSAVAARRYSDQRFLTSGTTRKWLPFWYFAGFAAMWNAELAPLHNHFAIGACCRIQSTFL
jgi:hypothetical protein